MRVDRAVSELTERLERAEDRATLARLMRRISARDREVLRLRFAADLTQAEIGQRVGLSQMQIRASSA